MFSGRYEHSIDGKGRVAVPIRFRETISGEYNNQPLWITSRQTCLVLHPEKEWAKTMEIANSISILNEQGQDWLRFYVSGGVECPIDSQGRILLPPHLRENVGLKRHVIFVSMLNHFEIWDKTQFNQRMKKVGANFPAIAAGAQKFGA